MTHLQDLSILISKSLTLVVSRLYQPPYDSLIMGELFGFKKQLPRWLINDLTSAGLIHVVVVSGYNISFLMTYMHRILRIFKLHKNLTYILALVLTFIYVCFVGFSPPVVRAYIMSCILLFGKMLGRRSSMIYVIGVSAIFMAIFNLEILQSISFQLSFASTIGLVSLSGLISEKMEKIFGLQNPKLKILVKFKDLFFSSFCESIACSILTWPIISFYFRRVSILSPIPNALGLFTVPVVTVLGSLSLITYKVPGPVSFILAFVTTLFLKYFVFIAHLFSNTGIAYLQVNKEFLIFYYVVIAIYILKKEFIV